MRTLLVPSLLLAAASCSSSAYAAGPRVALAVSPEKTRAPYDVQIITEDGEVAPTYAFKGRFYVQGNDNSRYTIRIVNPTPRRVEAVVSVDGLDVVDGESGDLHKRGYIVPAYGETRIEGFRTSLADVATFRFSSVDNSYAGKKGKARNVGVIAVALFEEQGPPPDQQIIAPSPARPYYWGGDDEEASAPRGGAANRGRVAHADKKAAEAPAAKDASPAPSPPRTAATGGAAAPSRRYEEAEDDDYQPPVAQGAPRTYRPGLGTEFGESRYSAASYTKFVRAGNRPIAIAELRYNDAAGLIALGIPVQPMPDEGEIMLRETADPFPGDRGHFSRAP